MNDHPLIMFWVLCGLLSMGLTGWVIRERDFDTQGRVHLIYLSCFLLGPILIFFLLVSFVKPSGAKDFLAKIMKKLDDKIAEQNKTKAELKAELAKLKAEERERK
ncbi:MAG: hypothetical protein DRQ88_05955 [Epsilonproteobacteria bacterium]|nr:MAG: hypothetical protein DRQ88_05955 [Campylobacterota bacterium]